MTTSGHGPHEQHNPSPELETDPLQWFGPEFWDARYGSADPVWSGNPNPQLVAQVADLTPGDALDVGSGEGGDAIWLAGRGWRVTALDVSQVGLDRAADRAARAGVGERIAWQQADLRSWRAGPQRYDLVSAQFMYLPPADRTALYAQLADLVRPGGTLLIVGHHPLDLETTTGRPHLPDFLFTGEQLAAALDQQQWDVVVVAAVARDVEDAEGRSITLHDAVLRAVRRQA